jgi:cytochrome b involved in lipid metabolism
MNDTEIVAQVPDEARDHVSYAELQRHTNPSSLWVLIGGMVYDVTSLLSSHPGGTGPLFKYAGKDATWAYPISTPLNGLMEIMDMQQGIYANTPTRYPSCVAAFSVHWAHRPGYSSPHFE